MDRPDDIQPDESLEVGEVERVPSNPEARVAYAVPFTHDQLAALERIARERGITAIGAVQRLVEEGLEARAHRDAGAGHVVR